MEAQMQIYLTSLATLLLVGIGILFNNARISDLNTNMNKRIDDLRADFLGWKSDLQGRFERLETQQARFEEQQARLENILVGKLTEVEARLSRIESHLNLQ